MGVASNLVSSRDARSGALSPVSKVQATPSEVTFSRVTCRSGVQRLPSALPPYAGQSARPGASPGCDCAFASDAPMASSTAQTKGRDRRSDRTLLTLAAAIQAHFDRLQRREPFAHRV